MACLAGYMTNYIAPVASGSGVAETMAYFNGVKYPDLFSLKTLIVKILGVTLAVTSKLSVGKEGPLVHIGACFGNLMPYIKCVDLRFLQTDSKKRELVAAGVACGVSCAFGSPIGGVLFAYETSS